MLGLRRILLVEDDAEDFDLTLSALQECHLARVWRLP